METFGECPHTLDLSRLQVLENEARAHIALSQKEGDLSVSLFQKLQSLNGRRMNLRERLKHSHRAEVAPGGQRSGGDAESLRPQIEKVEREIDELEQQIGAANDRQSVALEKFSVTSRLIERCKKFVQQRMEG